MTHRVDLVRRALDLNASGLCPTEIARKMSVPRSTVRDWVHGKVPRGRDIPANACAKCGAVHHLYALPAVYVYLLGMYLGDGCLSEHPRDVYKLRISLDSRYPGIAAECEAAIRTVMPKNRVGRVRHPGWQELFSYSKSWPCLFPQHGPGRKHERTIELADWQRRFVALHPELLLRGLIQSDGCRFQNTGRGWSHPRYSFTNLSEGIRTIFCDACDSIDVHWTVSGGTTIYVSRKADVATLDRFIGPKR
jgi:hypothetical protein